jgi:hypothetical protein
MATRSLAYSAPKLTKRMAADRMADLIENSMGKMGLPEEEKNKRVRKFATRVNREHSSKRK